MRKALAAATLVLLLPLVGCAPAQPFATLPRDAIIGVGDPTRAAVIGSTYAFATPDVMAGHPEAAARAAAQALRDAASEAAHRLATLRGEQAAAVRRRDELAAARARLAEDRLREGALAHDAAEAIAPAVRHVLEALGRQAGVILTRMSGSGATCFALFDDGAARDAAAAAIAAQHPAWWQLATAVA